jgi:hypothetical protein
MTRLTKKIQVNIPFTMLHDSYLDRFVKHRLNPEIGIDAVALDRYFFQTLGGLQINFMIAIARLLFTHLSSTCLRDLRIRRCGPLPEADSNNCSDWCHCSSLRRSFAMQDMMKKGTGFLKKPGLKKVLKRGFGWPNL